MQNEQSRTLKAKVSRRGFLKWFGALGAAAATLGSGKKGRAGIGSYESVVKETGSYEIDKFMEIVTNSHPHNCGGKCFFKLYVKNVNGVKRLVKLTSAGDVGLDGKEPDGLLTEMQDDEEMRKVQIRACPRGYAQIKRLYAPDRLKYPMIQTKKKGDITGFKRITWDEAYDVLAEKYRGLQERAKEIGYLPSFSPEGSGALSLLHLAPLHGMKFMNLLGKGKYGSIAYYGITSSGSYSAAGLYTFDMITSGAVNNSTMDAYKNSKMVVIWGGDPTTSFHYRSQMQFYMSKMKEKGIKVIVVDPMHTDAAATYATGTDRTPGWIPVRPGGDTYLANGMMYVMYKKGLYDKEYVKKRGYGFFKEDEGKEQLSVHLNTYLRYFAQDPSSPNVNEYTKKLFDGQRVLMPEGTSYESYIESLDKEHGGYSGVMAYFADRSGVDADVIENFATDFATIKPVALYSMLAPQRHIQGMQYAKSVMCLTFITNNTLVPGGGPGGIPLADIMCGGLPVGILTPGYASSGVIGRGMRIYDTLIASNPILKGILNSSVTKGTQQLMGTAIGVLLFLTRGAAPLTNLLPSTTENGGEVATTNLIKFLVEWLPKSNLENYMAGSSYTVMLKMVMAMGIAVSPAGKSVSFYKWADLALNGIDERPAKTFAEENFGHDVKDKEKKLELDVILCLAGNMIQQNGNCNRNIYAVTHPSHVTGRIPYLIVHEQMMTPTARYADIVLPINTHMEREDLSYGAGPYFLNMSKAVDSLYESKSDMQVFYEVSDRMGFNFFKGAEGIVKHSGPIKNQKEWDDIEVRLKKYMYHGFLMFPFSSDDAKSKIPKYEDLLKTGIVNFGTVGEPTYNDLMNLGIPKDETGQIKYFASDTTKFNFFAPEQYRRMKTYYEDSNGTHPDAGILLDKKAHTPTRMDPRPIPLYNFEGYDMIRDGKTKYGLIMTAKASRNKVHSTYDNISFIKDEFPGHIWMNPVDAEARGIKNNDTVYIYNDRGCAKAGAYVTERIRPGACDLEQGSWYSPSTTEFATVHMDMHHGIEDPNHKEHFLMPVDVGGCSATLVPTVESGPHDPHHSIIMGGSGMSHNSVLVEVSKVKPE